MTPREYLLSSPTRAQIKRKIHFNNIDSKRLRLDPTPKIEDSTVEKYHARVSTQLQNDRRKLQVMMPFGEKWELLNKRQNDQESKITDLSSAERIRRIRVKYRRSEERTAWRKDLAAKALYR